MAEAVMAIWFRDCCGGPTSSPHQMTNVKRVKENLIEVVNFSTFPSQVTCEYTSAQDTIAAEKLLPFIRQHPETPQN